MKKVSFLVVFLTANIFIVPGIRSAADRAVAQQKSAVGLISPNKLLFGLTEELKRGVSMIERSKEIGRQALNLFGLDDKNQKVEILIDSSIKLAKELKRKGGARIEQLEKLFVTMKKATNPLMINLQKAITNITNMLQLVAPIMKLGDKTIKTIVTKIDFSQLPEGRKIKEVVEIPASQIINKLPNLIVDKIFKPIKLYTSAIENLIKTIKQNQDALKAARKKIEQLKKDIKKKIDNVGRRFRAFG